MTSLSHEDTQENVQALGAFLRAIREQKGVSIDDVAKSTKISKPVLIAIEEDNFERLPAAAFCRGFYSLYADFLELDAKDILEQLSQSKGLLNRSSKEQSQPPLSKSHSFSNYAEPSAISPATGKSVFFIACLAAIIGICWYFNWNPVDFIANQLNPQTQTLVQQAEPQAVSTLPEATETEEIITVETEKDIQVEPATMAPYNLEIDFYTDGILKVTLDDGFVLDKQYTAGKTLQWEVKKKIILDMPEQIQGNLRLNGIKIPLPEAENGRRRLSLPEDLLN